MTTELSINKQKGILLIELEVVLKELSYLTYQLGSYGAMLRGAHSTSKTLTDLEQWLEEVAIGSQRQRILGVPIESLMEALNDNLTE